jgi:hypothetical protein
MTHLFEVVAGLVAEMGETDIYRLHSKHPEFSRAALQYGIKSANKRGLIKIITKGRNGKPSTYGPGEGLPERKTQPSVFGEAVKLPEWHLKHKGGRTYSPLGGWNG